MMNDDDDITSLWQRHLLAAVRDNLSAASVQAIPSIPRSLDGEDSYLTKPERKESIQVGSGWDEQIDSVVDALQELTVQSPTTINTADAYSPDNPSFPDREGYAETALSSPQNSSWSRTIAPTKPATATQAKRLSSYGEAIEAIGDSGKHSPRSPKGKGKGLDPRPQHYLVSSETTATKRQPSLPSWYTERHLPTISHPDADAEDMSYENYYRSYNPSSQRNMPPDPPTVTVRYAPSRVSRMMESPAQEVHVLILTWAKRDDSATTGRRGADDGSGLAPLLSPTLDPETDAVRSSFKRRGYRVQCRRIPEDYPTAAVETILDRFLDKSVEGKSMLVIYYHGFGNTDSSGRMVFSSDKHATSSFFWDDVRDPIMQSPGDVLLIFDCCPLPRQQPQPQSQSQSQPQHDPAHEGTLLIEPGMISSPSTKQLLGICAAPPIAPSQTSTATELGRRPEGIMTSSLCKVLNRTFAERQVSVQNLCSNIKEDLKVASLSPEQGPGALSSKVFVTQLGGGQLGDICLPWFRD